ncbi:MAG: GAF domain-containing protein [Desulforhopalus sp.]|nr:GAF domain-containing protein [Desulforhopalus sp.]
MSIIVQPQIKKTSSTSLLILLLVLLALDLGVGIWLFNAQQQQQHILVEDQLKAISSLKVKEIAKWRHRIVDETNLLAEGKPFSKAVERYLADSQPERAQLLLDTISTIARHYHLLGVLLVDPQGNTMVSHGTVAGFKQYNSAENLTAQAIGTKQTVLSDLYRDDQGVVSMAAATPLYYDGRLGEALLGVFILVNDTSKFLFPLVGGWPIPSKTAESLLVRGDGDDVLYLNKLRHRPDSGMQLRIPKTRLQVPAAAAVNGRLGIIKGVDYRGEQVIAYAEEVPNSPWILISKIDDREAFAAWRNQSLLLILAFSGIAALLIALGLAIQQRTKRNYFRQLFAAEQLLRRNAERSSVILQGIADGIIVSDHEGRIELLNPAAERLTGLLHVEAVGKPLAEVFSLIDERTGLKIDDPVTQVLRDGKDCSQDRQAFLLGKSGKRTAIASTASPLHDTSGNISGAVLVFRDQSKTRHLQRLTEKRLEITLFAGNHSLDDLLTKVLDEVCELVDSPIGFFHFVEDDQKTLSLQQWSSRTLREFCRIEGKGRHYDIAQAGVWVDCLRQRKPVVHNDYASMPGKKGLPPGHAAVIRELVVPVTYNDKIVAILGVGNKPVNYDEDDVETVAYLAGMVFHLVEAKRIDQQLRESLQTSDDLVRAIPAGLFIYQYYRPNRLVLVGGNPEAARLIGQEIDQLIGLDFDTLWPKAKDHGIHTRLIEVLQTGEMMETEDQYYTGDRLTEAFRIRAFPLPGTRLGVAFENITDLKQSEKEKEKIQSQLQQAQKMESVGRLAGGVAHDFNNMLSVILGNAEMALEQSKSEPKMHRELEEIKKAALRSADLTRQLLAFARKQAVTPKIINLNHTIEGVLKMLRRLIGEDIQLAWLPQTGLAPVFIDPSQVDQILANLCVNARDAIHGLGKIIIETGTVTLNSEYCADNPGFLPGQYTMLSVSDSGSGITKDTLKHIFEPFFTTKKQGEGTGLGLAMVYGIVKQNGGFIKVYSEPGQGSTFRIYLPQHTGEVEGIVRQEEPEPPLGQGQLILLVEDETVILELNARMLESLGYRVVATSSANMAIQLAEKHKDKLRLLLSDIIMPEMNGNDLARVILQANPTLKCLFMSGYTANVIARQGFLPEGLHFLQKPFMKRDLAIKLGQIFSA